MPRKKTTASPEPAKRSTRIPTPVQDVECSRCMKCGSTKRSAYSNIRRKPIAGADRLGKPFSAVVWKSCQCVECGQKRTDRTVEYSVTTD